MHLLSKTQLTAVSGGEWVFITENWKNEQAYCSGLIGGAIGAAIGGLLAISMDAQHAISMGTLGGAIGAAMGIGAGGGFTRWYHQDLPNNQLHFFYDQRVYY